MTKIAGPEVVIAAGNSTATINLDRIDMGATITLTYNLRGQDDDDDDEADDDSLIAVLMETPADAA